MIIKKIIVNLFIVSIVVIVLDFVIGKELRHFYFKENSGFQFRTTYAMETTEADILIFGSSRANHNYVPEVFEDSLRMTYYNTGRDGNGIIFQTTLLRSILNRYTPKLIILDYYGDFKNDATAYDRLSSLLPYYRTHEEVRKIVELRSPFEKIKLISEIYPFNSEILSIVIGNLEFNKKRYPDHKGYIPLYKEWPAKIDSAADYQRYEVDSVKLSALREFIKITKKSGAKIVVIYSPIFRRFKKNREVEICDGICAAEDVPFWDYSKDSLFLNNRHLFQDIEHLNNEGAIIFSNLVVAKIEDNILSANL